MEDKKVLAVLTLDEQLRVRNLEVDELRLRNNIHEYKASADAQLQKMTQEANAKVVEGIEYLKTLCKQYGLDENTTVFDNANSSFIPKA